MNNPYDLHSWSKEYRQEALRESRMRHLLEEARKRCELRHLGLAWRSLLAPLLRETRVAG
jgi:hypothetical protein